MNKNYVIKQKDLYLHSEEENLIFKKEKHGAMIFDKKQAESVLAILEKDNIKHVFKATVKEKMVLESPEVKIGG